MTWTQRLCGLVAILLLRTGDAFRAIEQRTHYACHAVYLRLIVDAGLTPSLAHRIYVVDRAVRVVCSVCTVRAYRWCNWWRRHCLKAITVRVDKAVPPGGGAIVVSLYNRGAAARPFKAGIIGSSKRVG